MANFWKSLSKPIIGLAPMSGITDEPMRFIQSVLAKPSVVYTEFVNVDGFQKKPDYFRKIIRYEDIERPVVVQIFGSDPDLFYLTALEISKLGFDGIDINMGCPANTVMERGGGGALIGKLDKCERIIQSVRQGIEEAGKKIALSVKTRIISGEGETRKWAQFLARQPIDAVCLHGRYLPQRSTGPVHWNLVAKTSQAIQKEGKIFLGNGGVTSYREGKSISKKYGFDGVLIGQAAFGNPWAFERKGALPDRKTLFETILKHARLAWKFYGERDFVKFRKHLSWYPKGFAGSRELRTRLVQVRTLSEVESIIEGELNKKY